MDPLRSLSMAVGRLYVCNDSRKFILALFACLAICFCNVSARSGQTGTVLSHQKISDTEGDFTGILDNVDKFGSSVASLGDLNGDGVVDVVVGAPGDDDGGGGRGALWILFIDPNGDVIEHQKISDTQGNFTGILDNGDAFGGSVSPIGDLNGDGVGDIAVGATGDSDVGFNHGAVWILFMDSNSMVKSHQKISETQGNFTGVLSDYDNFGCSVTSLGDFDGDGFNDIAVGAAFDDDGGINRGSVWMLFLDPNGMVKSHQKISDTQGNFTGVLSDYDTFGCSVASLGDLDGDSVTDIAVGAKYDDDGGGSAKGAIWVLFLNSDGTVKNHQKISDVEGNFGGSLEEADCFGYSVSSLGDFDGDGTVDIVVGAPEISEGNPDTGSVWILFLNNDGTVKDHVKISDNEGNFMGDLDEHDYFGISVTSLGDLNKDDMSDIAIGSRYDDDGGRDRGAVWVLFLYDCLYELEGDVNNDCKVDFLDIAVTAANWLIDCDLIPDDPACIPR